MARRPRRGSPSAATDMARRPRRGRPSAATSDAAASASSATPAAGRPLRLVYRDSDGKLVMDPEAVAALQLVKGPVGVVSVCGRAREGKSFLLNQLLGESSCFQVTSTDKLCTKGLWIWILPMKMIAVDGTEYNLVLLDTEGIDAYDQTDSAIQIFSIAVPLSSMFIYNKMGGIDEASIDRLSQVTEMTLNLVTASKRQDLSPVFVWLLRDFYLDLSKTNITPKNYLEDALGPVQSGERDVSSKNAIRESICALFPHRECFTLVRPVNNEKDLQRLDQLPMNKFRPEFTSGLDAFTKFVFDRTRIKQVGASNMTGPILAGLTQSFLDAINTGAVAMISSSCQAPMPLQPLSCRFCGRNPNLRVGSGSTGVRCTVSGRYQAYLKVNGKQKVVGTFDTEDAAVNARFRELEKLTAKTKRSKAHNKALKTKTKCFKAQDKTLSSGGSSSQQAIERADLNEELSKKTHEYEGCIKNLQTNLTQVEDEYKKKLTEVEDEYKKKLWKETLAKRELYNIIQTLKGSIRVFCRSRPLTEKEILSGSKCAIDFNRADDGCIGIMDGGTKKTFEFDRVYKVNDNQAEVYADASPLITSVMDGYNVCIFAYGQTGAGKTFTMLGTEWDRGLNYRAVEELFKIVEERKNTVTYDISFSLLEVYNEQIRDLLATSPSSKWFEVKETGDGSHHVPGIIETNVKDVHQAWNILQSGSKSRVVEANNVNQDSSRSHCVICIMVRAKNLINGKYTRSKLSLIDLAGSERLSKTQAEGERLKEAQYINLSLSALGRVIAAITSRAEHIPYRNSKLTQILQDSLGGDSKVLMFVNISPSDCEVAESLSSLKFARDVKRVELGLAKKHLDTTKIHQNVKLMENYQPKRKETCTAAKVAKIPLRQATLASATAAHKMAASSKKAKLFSPLANMRI